MPASQGRPTGWPGSAGSGDFSNIIIPRQPQVETGIARVLPGYQGWKRQRHPRSSLICFDFFTGNCLPLNCRIPRRSNETTLRAGYLLYPISMELGCRRICRLNAADYFCIIYRIRVAMSRTGTSNTSWTLSTTRRFLILILFQPKPTDCWRCFGTGIPFNSFILIGIASGIGTRCYAHTYRAS